MRPRFPALVLALPLACTQAGAGGPADAEALRAVTEELVAARAAFEADRAAMQQELAELRKAVAGIDAKLAERAERRVPVPSPVRPEPASLTPGPLPMPDPAELAMSIDPSLPSVPGVDPLAGKVRCETDGRCKLQRAYLESLFADPMVLLKQARIVPSMRDDVHQGYKLYGLRRGSLPKAVGLKNGDLVRSIDGKPLGSMDETMKLFTELRRQTKYDLEIERKGVLLTLTLEIVESIGP
jgi:hypothetical protein